MLTFLLIVVAAAALVWLVIAALTYGGAWRHFRGQRVVVCPENESFAAVKVDSKHAGATAVRRDLELRLKECSRWPEKEACGQECLAQIEVSPMECLARTILERWYEGASCVVCNKSIGSIDWKSHKPALMSPERRTLTWNEVPAETLPNVLATHWPVCWDCSIVERLVGKHPEVVTVRPEHQSPGITPLTPTFPKAGDSHARSA